MIVLAGPSASGKTEVAKLLAKKYNIKKVITTTTREMRINEVDGVDYFFVTKEQFLIMLNKDRFVEHTIYNNNYYGSTKDQISDNRCIIVDPTGLKAYASLSDPRIIVFFLNCSEDIRRERMISRGDKEEKIISRLKDDRDVFDSSNLGSIDFYIDNENNNIEAVCDHIYRLYKEKIKQLTNN